MPNINEVTLCGHLTRDPELRTIGNGHKVVSFGVAVNREYKKGDDWHKETAFVDCECWGKRAEYVAEMRKGARVFVTGYLVFQRWTTKDGQKRTALRVRADQAYRLEVQKREAREAGPVGAADAGDVQGDDVLPF